MILIIRDGWVIDTFSTEDMIPMGWYLQDEIVDWPEDIVLFPNGRYPDPRRSTAYQDLRAATYPPITEQLDMIYWDKVNGTTIWQDTIAAVKTQYPKP
jgi:hypothetical protein